MLYRKKPNKILLNKFVGKIIHSKLRGTINENFPSTQYFLCRWLYFFAVYLSMSLLTRWHLSHASGKIDKLAICINDGLRNCREEKDIVQLC